MSIGDAWLALQIENFKTELELWKKHGPVLAGVTGDSAAMYEAHHKEPNADSIEPEERTG